MSFCPPKSNKLPKPFYEQDGITIYNGNCFHLIELLPRFTLCATDPPYGLKWEGAGKWAKKLNQYKEIKDWDKKPETLLPLLECSDHQIIWGGHLFELPPTRGLLVWEKPCRVRTMADCEIAWTSFDKPAKSFTKKFIHHGKGHPTQKPVDLMRWCLEYAKIETGSLVIDPFMGSGTTLVACKQKGIRAVGIEMRLDYCKVAVDRLKQDYLAL